MNPLRGPADQTAPLPEVPELGDPPKGRHARRRARTGWGIAAIAVVAIPVGLALGGWVLPGALYGGPSSDPHTRYEPDIPRYPTSSPTPSPRRQPPPYVRRHMPVSPTPTATPHHRPPRGRSHVQRPATSLTATPRPQPPAATPFTTTPTPTGSSGAEPPAMPLWAAVHPTSPTPTETPTP